MKARSLIPVLKPNLHLLDAPLVRAHAGRAGPVEEEDADDRQPREEAEAPDRAEELPEGSLRTGHGDHGITLPFRPRRRRPGAAPSRGPLRRRAPRARRRMSSR